MRKKLLSGVCLFMTGLIPLLCTCKELPTTPYVGENLKITMFISGGMLEVNAGDSVSVGLVVNIPSLVKKLTVIQGDDQKVLTIPLNRPESTQPDTVYFRTMYKVTGKKEVPVNATLSADGLNKTFPFSIRVLNTSGSYWKQDTMTLVVQEDTIISYSLLSLLKNPALTNIVFSSPENGINGTDWKYTVPWGAASKDTISLFASNSENEVSKLKVFLNVLSKDTGKPMIALVNPSTLDATVSDSAVVCKFTVTDTLSGIGTIVVKNGTTILTDTSRNGSTFQCTVRGLKKGEKSTITIEASDKSILKNSSALQLYLTYDPLMLDNVKPELRYRLPANGSAAVATTQTSIEIVAVDQNSGIDSVWAFRGTTSLTVVQKDSIYGVTLNNLVAGKTDTVIFKAQDKSSLKNTDVLPVLITYNPSSIDFTGPVIKLSSPAQDRSKVTKLPAKLSVVCKDANGIGSVNYTFSSLKGAMTKDSDSTYSVELANLVKGDNQITILATDASINKNVTDTVFTLVYDTLMTDTIRNNVAPKFDTDTIKATVITRSQFLLNLKDTCTDSNGDAISYSLVAPSKGLITTTMYGYTPSDSDTGKQTVTIIARDFELSDTLTIIFTVKRDDTDPPSVTFTPTLGDTIFSIDTSCTISVKALDASGIDRVETTSDSKTPSKVLKVNDTIWNIKVSSLGSSNIVPVIITIFDKSPRANAFKDTAIIKYKPADKDKPYIQITSLTKDTAIINKPTCDVTFKCIDASGIQSVSASDGTTSIKVTSISDSVFSATVVNIPSDRYLIVTFTATDKSTNANVNTRTICLKYDPTATDVTPPSITFKNPAADNTVIGTSSATVDILCTDDNGVASLICEFGGKMYAATKGNNNLFSVTIPGLAKGANVLKVTATDGSTNANVATASITVKFDPSIVDETGPTITLANGLTDNITVESSSITLKAECYDLYQVASVLCTFGGNSFTVTNTGNIYSVTVTGLNSGMTNIITLTATDGSSNANKTIKTIAVKYDPTLNDKTGPTITLVNPTGETAIVNTPSLDLKLVCTDLNNVGSVSYTFNTQTTAMTPGANNTYAATLTNLSSASVNTISITATDGSTNKNKTVKVLSVSYVPKSTIDSVVIQPGPADAQDAGIITAVNIATTSIPKYLNYTYGTRECISVGQYDENTVCRGLIRFTIPTLKPDSILSAKLILTTQTWLSSERRVTYTMAIHKILKSWIPGNTGAIETCNSAGFVNTAAINGVSARERYWGNQDGTEDWSEVGIGQNDKDASSKPSCTASKTASDLNPWEIDLTSLCKEWIINPATNYGVLLKDANDLTTVIAEKGPMPVVYSGETSDSKVRPKLVIIYKK